MVDKPADLCIGDAEDWVYVCVNDAVRAFYGHDRYYDRYYGRNAPHHLDAALREERFRATPAWNTEPPDGYFDLDHWRKVRRSEFEALLDMERARLAVGA